MRFSKFLVTGIVLLAASARRRKRRPTKMSAERRRKRKFRPGISLSGLTERDFRRDKEPQRKARRSLPRNAPYATAGWGRRQDWSSPGGRQGRPRNAHHIGLSGPSEATGRMPPRSGIISTAPCPEIKAGTLSANEVYALTAFILAKSGIIQEDDVMDAKTLPKVQMPNRNGFVPQQFGYSGRTEAGLHTRCLPVTIASAQWRARFIGNILRERHAARLRLRDHAFRRRGNFAGLLSKPGKTVCRFLLPRWPLITSPSTERKSVVSARSRPSFN